MAAEQAETDRAMMETAAMLFTRIDVAPGTYFDGPRKDGELPRTDVGCWWACR